MTTPKIKTIYEDNSLLVLEKPSGVVANTSETTSNETLQDYLREKLRKELAKVGEDSEYYKRAGLVHRLDKETSGIILAAKNEAALTNLQAQFKNREVEKEYKALVIGELDEQLIKIDAPIARNPRHRTKMAVVADGKQASTSIRKARELEFNGEKVTLVVAKPLTGRTHQIRVHLAALEHPVVGDSLYSGKKRSAKFRKHFERLMLHASKISFKHPETNEKVIFESNLPKEFNS